MRRRWPAEVPGCRMRRGEGERRDDCARYSECLGAFVRATWARGFCEPEAHCPRTCSAYVAVTDEERRAEAVAGRGSSSVGWVS